MYAEEDDKVKTCMSMSVECTQALSFCTPGASKPGPGDYTLAEFWRHRSSICPSYGMPRAPEQKK